MIGHRLRQRGHSQLIRWIIGLLIVFLLIGAGALVLLRGRPASYRLMQVRRYRQNPSAHADWALAAGERCHQAPFVMPTSGFVGFVWGDSFRPGHHHQGLDIFGPKGLGQTRVVAAYDGYLTRLDQWRSAVILRHPRDPLQPDRQIWTYYTHMADQDGNSFVAESFPAGTQEQFVRAGTVLGYQGNYSGSPDNPTGIHLHFSIVMDDGEGHFRNELKIENTVDPSPYLGFEVNADRLGQAIPICK
jgi:murein DD-endopeptidase MepM/ murein hydrolase activator NlpD